MAKKVKQLLSIILTVVLLAMNTSTAFAANSSGTPYNTKVTVDNSTTRVAESYDEHFKYISTYDKETKIAVVQQIDINTNAVITEVVANANGIVPYENTFSNFEYDKTYGSPNKWELRRPDGSLTGTIYFKTDETSANSSYLAEFKDAVDQINSLEGKIIAAIGLEAFTGALSVFLAYITGGVGAPLAAYLASLGFAGGALDLAADLDYQCNVALDRYWEVYNRSDVYY